MLILTNSYTDVIYSFLVSVPQPVLPKKFAEIQKSSQIKLYTFQRGIFQSLPELEMFSILGKNQQVHTINTELVDKIFMDGEVFIL
jgi:hypothetical protein